MLKCVMRQNVKVCRHFLIHEDAHILNPIPLLVSIGISHNILLARLATRHAKPAGSYHLLPENIPEIMAPLQISDLHGFGWSTKQKAQEKLGAVTLGELAKKSKGVLIDALGKGTGEILYNAIRGIDDKKLESDKPRKSVSCEINVSRLSATAVVR